MNRKSPSNLPPNPPPGRWRSCSTPGRGTRISTNARRRSKRSSRPPAAPIGCSWRATRRSSRPPSTQRWRSPRARAARSSRRAATARRPASPRRCCRPGCPSVSCRKAPSTILPARAAFPRTSRTACAHCSMRGSTRCRWARSTASVFLVNASIGLYPQLIEDREAFKQRFGRNRVVALVSGLASVLLEHRQSEIVVELEEERRTLRSTTLFVGANELQLERLGFDESAAVAARRARRGDRQAGRHAGDAGLAGPRRPWPARRSTGGRQLRVQPTHGPAAERRAPRSGQAGARR